MKTTKLYMAGTVVRDVMFENRLLSYSYIKNYSGDSGTFCQAILERRELRKQAKAERQEKNFSQNEK